jgi:hypothetical protein
MRKTSRYKKKTIKKRTIKKKKTLDGGTKKKNTSIEIEEKLDGAGIYCFLPYDSLDLSGSGLFKIMITNDIVNNVKDMKLYYPGGFNVIAALLYKDNFNDKEEYFQERMKNILKEVMNNKGIINEKHENGWIFTTVDVIHIAFKKESKKRKPKSKLFVYNLTGIDKDTLSGKEIEKKENPLFKGKIVFHT